MSQEQHPAHHRKAQNPFQEGYTPGQGKAVIHIVVNPETGHLTVVPTTARLGSKQPVAWKVWKEVGGETIPQPGASFLLTFRDPGAVGAGEIRSGSKEAAEAAGGTRGRHNYKVMVVVDGVIHADVGCPSVRIDR